MRKQFLFALLLSAAALSGCAAGRKTVREGALEWEVEQLKGRLIEADVLLQSQMKLLQEESAQQIRQLTQEKEEAIQRAAQEKEREAQQLLAAERQLTEGLQKELGEARARLAMTERGLVLTLLDEIFFDSGKAAIKPEGFPTLEKVAKVLKETVPDLAISVEGHTDTEPIRHSGWRSNWELSAARALAVVHFLIGTHRLPQQRLRAVGCGEYQPVASNETPAGRRQNRRVEIVILPKLPVRPSS